MAPIHELSLLFYWEITKRTRHSIFVEIHLRETLDSRHFQSNRKLCYFAFLFGQTIIPLNLSTFRELCHHSSEKMLTVPTTIEHQRRRSLPLSIPDSSDNSAHSNSTSANTRSSLLSISPFRPGSLKLPRFGKMKKKSTPTVRLEHKPRQHSRHRRSTSLAPRPSDTGPDRVDKTTAPPTIEKCKEDMDWLKVDDHHKKIERSFSETEIARINKEKRKPDNVQLVARYGLMLTRTLDDDWSKCALDKSDCSSMASCQTRNRLIWAEDKDECFVSSYFLADLPSPLVTPPSPLPRSPSSSRSRSISTTNPPQKNALCVPSSSNGPNSAPSSTSPSYKGSPEHTLKRRGRRASLADIFTYVKQWHRRRFSNEKNHHPTSAAVVTIPKFSFTICCVDPMTSSSLRRDSITASQ